MYETSKQTTTLPILFSFATSTHSFYSPKSAKFITHPSSQYAFLSHLTIVQMVTAIICISSQNVQFLIYHISWFIRACIAPGLLVSPRWPLTCAQPVIPGFTKCRCIYRFTEVWDSSFKGLGCGRGPTIANSHHS